MTDIEFRREQVRRALKIITVGLEKLDGVRDVATGDLVLSKHLTELMGPESLVGAYVKATALGAVQQMGLSEDSETQELLKQAFPEETQYGTDKEEQQVQHTEDEDQGELTEDEAHAGAEVR